MDKLIEQAIKNCKINKYEKYFEEVCKEYKSLLDAENQQLNLQNVIVSGCDHEFIPKKCWVHKCLKCGELHVEYKEAN